MKTKFLKTMMLGLVLTQVGCQQEENDNPSPQKESVSVQNGILVIADKTSLQNIAGKGLELIEIPKGFKSMLQIQNDIAAAENEFEARFLQASPEGKRQFGGKTHSDLYEHYLAAGVIKAAKDKDGAEYYRFANERADLAPVLNAKGMVVIDKVLYQFLPDGIKQAPVTDAGLDKAIADINLINTTSAENFIKYKSISSNGTSTTSNFTAGNSWDWQQGVVAQEGSKRISLYVRWLSTTGWSPTINDVAHYAEIRAEDKNVFGNWKAVNQIDWISWNYGWTFPYYDRVTSPYSSPTSGWAGFTDSGYSGGLSQSYWVQNFKPAGSWYALAGLDFSNAFNRHQYQWPNYGQSISPYSAARWGGANGIKATVTIVAAACSVCNY